MFVNVIVLHGTSPYLNEYCHYKYMIVVPVSDDNMTLFKCELRPITSRSPSATIWHSSHISHIYLRINSAARMHISERYVPYLLRTTATHIMYCIMEAVPRVNMYVGSIARLLPGVARGQFLKVRNLYKNSTKYIKLFMYETWIKTKKR